MFYRPGMDAHGLEFDPLKACVAPRPIAWISTISRLEHRNLAPFSFFNAVAWAPPMVAFATPGRRSDGTGKDTLVNVEETGEFVVNVATFDLREEVNATSASVPADIDEFALVGLEAAPGHMVRAPRVAASPIQLECLHHQTVLLPGSREGRSNALVIGRVVGIHIRDDVLHNGRIDVGRVRPLVRLGYREWSGVDTVFEQEPGSTPLVARNPAAREPASS